MKLQTRWPIVLFALLFGLSLSAGVACDNQSSSKKNDNSSSKSSASSSDKSDTSKSKDDHADHNGDDHSDHASMTADDPGDEDSHADHDHGDDDHEGHDHDADENHDDHDHAADMSSNSTTMAPMVDPKSVVDESSLGFKIHPSGVNANGKEEATQDLIYAYMRIKMDSMIAERKELLSSGTEPSDPRVRNLEGAIRKARELLQENGESVTPVEPPLD